MNTQEKKFWNILTFQRRIEHPSLAKRSLFQLVHVYNALPIEIRSKQSVTEFQSCLTDVARTLCIQQNANWQTFLAARHWNEAVVEQWITLFAL